MILAVLQRQVLKTYSQFKKILGYVIFLSSVAAFQFTFWFVIDILYSLDNPNQRHKAVKEKF